MSKRQNPSSRSTSSSLIRRVRDGKTEAWIRLTNIYGPEIYRWVRRCGLRDADAADIAQNVFHAVAKNIATFRREKASDSFRGWLWRITRNKIHDHFRSLKGLPVAEGGSEAQRRLEQIPDAIPDSSDSDGSPGQASGVVHRTLELLRDEFKPQTWTIFWRLVIDGETTADVAVDLGLQKSAVRLAKYRVMCRLRQELKDLEDEF